jgi:hypothetical protein
MGKQKEERREERGESGVWCAVSSPEAVLTSVGLSPNTGSMIIIIIS